MVMPGGMPSCVTGASGGADTRGVATVSAFAIDGFGAGCDP